MAEFEDSHAENIIRAVRPDVLVKGQNWEEKVLDGGEFVNSYGGKVVLARLLEGRATSRTLERLRETK